MPLPPRVPGFLFAVALTVAACRTAAPVIPEVLPPPTLPVPTVASRWIVLQGSVLSLVSENRNAAAESALVQFAREYPRTPEGDRARWWRTLMRVDSRVTAGSDPTIALSQLDSLLADTLATDVRAEASLIRRNLVAIDSARRAEGRRRAQATQLATDRLDELKSARDSMGRLSAEIDRLRRRLRIP
jgi:hypothetical protein